MSIASVASDVIGAVFGNPGDLAKEVISTVSAHFPPDMSPLEKANAELAVQQLLFSKEKAADDADQIATQQMNDRMAAYEGTAKEIAAVPIIGPLLLLLRGAFRPAAAYGTVWADFQVFTGTWKLPTDITSQHVTLVFLLLNILVLGFYFGERTIKNLLPIVIDYLKAKLP